jgi:hypothetical protein
VDGQAFPHAPQFFGSFPVSVQAVGSHAATPDVCAQNPSTQ